MTDLKIIKATYYVPEIGVEKGTDVTVELSAQIVDGRLFYNGIYNFIFPDHFKSKYKRLRLEIEYGNINHIKDYGENEKINLPHDLGENLKNKINKKAPNNIFGDYVVGDKIGRDKNIDTNTKDHSGKYWLKKPEVVITIIIALISIPWWPSWYKGVLKPTPITYSEESVATTTPNLIDLYNRAFSSEGGNKIDKSTINAPVIQGNNNQINYNSDNKTDRHLNEGVKQCILNQLKKIGAKSIVFELKGEVVGTTNDHGSGYFIQPPGNEIIGFAQEIGLFLKNNGYEVDPSYIGSVDYDPNERFFTGFLISKGDNDEAIIKIGTNDNREIACQ